MIFKTPCLIVEFFHWHVFDCHLKPFMFTQQTNKKLFMGGCFPQVVCFAIIFWLKRWRDLLFFYSCNHSHLSAILFLSFRPWTDIVVLCLGNLCCYCSLTWYVDWITSSSSVRWSEILQWCLNRRCLHVNMHKSLIVESIECFPHLIKLSHTLSVIMECKCLVGRMWGFAIWAPKTKEGANPFMNIPN